MTMTKTVTIKKKKKLPLDLQVTDWNKGAAPQFSQFLRHDGTYKDRGFLGQVQLSGGGMASEYSVPINEGDEGKPWKEMPTLVPTLTKKERDDMTNRIIPNRAQIPTRILNKARAHAFKRILESKSPFYNTTEGG